VRLNQTIKGKRRTLTTPEASGRKTVAIGISVNELSFPTEETARIPRVSKNRTALARSASRRARLPSTSTRRGWKTPQVEANVRKRARMPISIPATALPPRSEQRERRKIKLRSPQSQGARQSDCMAPVYLNAGASYDEHHDATSGGAQTS
jgi:hypothetical protein